MNIFLIISAWIDRNILELGREMRLSYLPPLMVYVAAGISGLTGIVGTFFVKEYLGLSAEFLAALGFWAGIPWALKMPLGHLVDLIWRFKSVLVFVGAALITASLLIMIGLLSHTEAMRQIMTVETWFVISVLLAPIGYVVQDVVADAMTIEAVPKYDHTGQTYHKKTKRLMHTTMQTLGRVAIISGGILVALLNVYMFSGVAAMEEIQKIRIYTDIYQLALAIPVISLIGVGLGGYLKWRDVKRLHHQGHTLKTAWNMINTQEESPSPNWWILGGSLIFVVFTLGVGLNNAPYNQEIIFFGSLSIILFLMSRLVKELDADTRRTIVGTAIIIFIYRATPTPGPGSTWWMIDELGFDQQFLSVLALIASSLTLMGILIFRRFMAEKSIADIIVFLTIASTVLALPIVGMFYGLHEWTAAQTGGVVDARFIALMDTALESPLGQIAMIPMLAWIANSAPAHLKATFFAVFASFTNLALSASQLGTKYMNQIYTITREVKNPVSGTISTPADYSELGLLLITVTLLVLCLPLITVAIVRKTNLQSA
ncbi:MAG: folate/biopterin family MFS transporter [Gammaproteobacteria bacterium]|nr:folate/biopterin family MFS transporter [Gammaproteobacteria bacterium]